METRNREKAAILYEAIDSSDGFYSAHAAQRRAIVNECYVPPADE